MQKKWNVIIVGAGPGGCLASLKCANAGLNTLLIEKQLIPRDKVCSGMVMGKWAQNILTSEFGQIPDDVLVEPKSLLGYAVHVPGSSIRKLNLHTPITWRKKLDYWMGQTAEAAGALILDNSRVIGVEEIDDNRYRVTVTKDGKKTHFETDYLVGADGSRSAVRAALFPDLQPTYWHCYRECYNVKLDFPDRRFNFFSTIETAPFYFCTHDKDDVMLMEGGAPIGQIKNEIVKSRQFLIDNYDLDPSIKPIWKDSCVEPILYKELFTHRFRPARENLLIVGDAAGLNMPVTGEGVGTSLLSGRDAANAIIESNSGGVSASDIYLKTIDMCIARFQDIYQFSRSIKVAAESGDPEVLSDALCQSWEYSLKVFD